MSLEERLSAASAFLVQSPPGEINDVFTDLRSLVQDDAALERSILPALKQYNLEQYVVSTLPAGSGGAAGGGGKVIVTPDSETTTTEGQERHVDWRSAKTFSFDHMTAVSAPSSSASYTSNLANSPLFVSLSRA
jgi:capping protein alpha